MRVGAPPDMLPLDHSDPAHTGDIVEHPAAPATTDSNDVAARAAHHLRWRGDGHRQQSVVTLDLLDVDSIETDQQIATRTQASGAGDAGSRARVSAPRSNMRHVEVLVVDQLISAFDPRGPWPLHTTS